MCAWRRIVYCGYLLLFLTGISVRVALCIFVSVIVLLSGIVYVVLVSVLWLLIFAHPVYTILLLSPPPLFDQSYRNIRCFFECC